METSAVDRVKIELFTHSLWGCMTASGTGNTAQTEGQMDSPKYQQILVQISCS